MDLERRVKTLEQEVEILKNQVQSTLLDIQEKVLTNTYPSLRAESINVPPDDDGGGGGGRGYSNGAYQQTSAHSAPRQSDPVRYSDDNSYAQNNQRREKVVAFEALGSNKPAHKPAEAPQPDSSPESRSMDWQELETLEHWTLNKIEKIGPKRTYHLLKSYAEQGRIDDYTLDALVELVKLYAKPKKARSANNGNGRSADSHNSSSKQSQRSTATKSRASSNGHKPAPRRQPQPEPEPQDDEEDGKANMILRLIAGVSNASIGVSRGKKHG